MHILMELIGHPLAQRVGWVLLHSLWQGALIGAAFGLVRFALRRSSANARYLAGCLALALLATAPVLTTLLGLAPAMVGHSSHAPTGGHGPSFPAPQPLAPPHFEGGGLPLVQSAADFLAWLAPWLAIAWLPGVAFFSLRLSRDCWWVRRLRVRDNEPVDAGWLETLNDLRCRLEISRPVRLLKSALVEVPTVIGWLRPVILLPASSLTGLTPGQLEAILAHELAHVRRWDYAVNAFQCAVETVMFYHPAVWWISRCVREERENCCDDLVVKVCGDRLAYARALATLEELRVELPELAFAASGGSLLKRIRRLLGAGDETGPVTAREVGGLALLATGLALIVLGVFLLAATPAYSSGARIKVERDPSYQSGANDARLAGSYDPYFLQTEFEVIQSEAVLGKVIEGLDLRTEWGKRYGGGRPLNTQEAVGLLKGRMDLRPIRNTSLVEIRVFSENPAEAAKVANAIAEAYKALRQEQRVQLSKGGIRAVEDQLAEQERKVLKAQEQVEKLREELKIPDAVAMESAPSPRISAEALRKLEALRIETKAELVRQSSLLERLKALKFEDLTQVLPTTVQDSLLTSFLEQQALAEQGRVVRLKDYGPQHAEVVKLNAQLHDLQEKIKNRVAGILLALDGKVASLKDDLENLQQEVEKAVAEDIEKAKQLRPYFEKKRELEEMQRFRQFLTMKIASEQIDQNLPKSTVVEIMDAAVPALRATSPNRPRATALIGLGLLMDLAGLVMVRGRGRRERESASQ